MTDATEDEEKPLYIMNERANFSFLPRNADFTIVCSDEKWRSGVPYRSGSLLAFSVNKEVLIQASDFFAEMFGLAGDTSKAAGERIHVEERAHIIGNLLSAAFEPSGAFISTLNIWSELNEILLLAVKWKMDKARTVIFFAMQNAMMNLDRNEASKVKMDLAGFFVEAVRLGKSALEAASAGLRLQAKASVVIEMKPLTFTEIHFLEIGAAGCSQVAQALMELQHDGVLKCQH